MKYFVLTINTFFAFFLAGCRTSNLGPQSLKEDYSTCNCRISEFYNEQLLANLVRARYKEELKFTEIKTITHSITRENSFLLGAKIKPHKRKFLTKAKEDLNHEITVTYDELKNGSYVKRLMRPIQTTIVLSFIQSGWELDRVFGICVDRINNLRNVSPFNDTSPAITSNYKDFQRFVDLLRTLQIDDLIAIGENPTISFPDKYLRIKNETRFSQNILELKRIGTLSNEVDSYKIKDNFLDLDPKHFVLSCRSLIDVFSSLAQCVEVPSEDEKRGLVLTPNMNDNDICRRFFRVRYSNSRVKPKNAFVSVFYNRKWFYIEDSDLTSKSSFMLLTQLFNLQTADLKKNEAVLTL